MNNFTLTTFLTTNAEIDAQTANEIISKQKHIDVKKGEFLLMQGDICRHSFFVEKGLLRYYSIDSKGKEHILQFAPENWFIADRESLFYKQPSQHYIQALEDSTVVAIDDKFILDLSQNNKTFLENNNRLLHNHIRQLQKRIELLLSATAEERYLDFIKVYPDILLRVPQTMVASYLGIMPESLSRVRRELANKNFKK